MTPGSSGENYKTAFGTYSAVKKERSNKSVKPKRLDRERERKSKSQGDTDEEERWREIN